MNQWYFRRSLGTKCKAEFGWWSVCSLVSDFFPFMKSLSCNPIYMLFTLTSVLQLNAYYGIFTFLPKYLEQQYGKSTAEAIFLVGAYNLPPVCLGYLIGGFIMKKFKITVKKAAVLAFCLSVSEYLLFLCHFMLTCDNVPVAGLTTSYKGYVVSQWRSKHFHNCWFTFFKGCA